MANNKDCYPFVKESNEIISKSILLIVFLIFVCKSNNYWVNELIENGNEESNYFNILYLALIHDVIYF